MGKRLENKFHFDERYDLGITDFRKGIYAVRDSVKDALYDTGKFAKKGGLTALLALSTFGGSILLPGLLASCKLQDGPQINSPPPVSFDVNPMSGPAPLNVTYKISSPGNPNNDPLAYELDVDGNPILKQASPINYQNTLLSGSHTVEGIVTDTKTNLSGKDKRIVNVSSNPNAPTINGAAILYTNPLNSTNSPDVGEGEITTATFPPQDNQNDKYTINSATLASGNGAVTLDTSKLNSDQLIVKGIPNSISSNTPYSVNVTFTDNKTNQQGAYTINGVSHDHSDISLYVVDDERHYTPSQQSSGSQTAVARIFDSNGNPINIFNGVTGDPGYTNQANVPSTGQASLETAVRSDTLSGIKVQAKMVDSSGNSTSFWNTMNLSAGDTSIPKFAVKPFSGKYPIPSNLGSYDPVNPGTTPQQAYKDFYNQVNSSSNPGTYSIPNIEIVQNSPLDGSSFSGTAPNPSSGTQLYEAQQKAMEWSNIISGVADGGPVLRSGLNVVVDSTMQHGSVYNGTVIPNRGWEIVVPVYGNNPILNGNDGATRTEQGINPNNSVASRSYINADVQVLNQFDGLVSHEIGLAESYPNESTFSNTLTITPHLGYLASPSILDRAYALEQAEFNNSGNNNGEELGLTDLKGQQ